MGERIRSMLVPLHRITNADPERGMGDCVVCGPGTPIRSRPGRGHECKIRRAEDRQKESRKKAQRGYLLKAYGLTTSDYERIKEAQGGRCAVCREATDQLVVDHDHACCPDRKSSCGDCVRGLLCRSCNLALGYLRDSPDLALAVAAYLRQ